MELKMKKPYIIISFCSILFSSVSISHGMQADDVSHGPESYGMQADDVHDDLKKEYTAWCSNKGDFYLLCSRWLFERIVNLNNTIQKVYFDEDNVVLLVGKLHDKASTVIAFLYFDEAYLCQTSLTKKEEIDEIKKKNNMMAEYLLYEPMYQEICNKGFSDALVIPNYEKAYDRSTVSSSFLDGMKPPLPQQYCVFCNDKIIFYIICQRQFFERIKNRETKYIDNNIGLLKVSVENRGRPAKIIFMHNEKNEVFMHAKYGK